MFNEKEWKAQWYQENKERIRELNRKNYRKNKDAYKDRLRKSHLSVLEAGHKICPRCEEDKPIDLYKHGEDWVATYCIPCFATYRKTKKYPPTDVEAYRAYQRQYQFERRMKMSGDLTMEEWAEILEEFNHHCAYCIKSFDKLEMEHMIPVTRDGTLTRDNVVPACRSCNASKNNRTLLEFVEVGV